jgi:hypothetical protein
MKTFDDFQSALRRIVVVGTSLAAGGMAASLEALRPDFSFHLSLQTAAVFALAALALRVYWWIIFHPLKTSRQNFLRMTATGLLAAAGVAAFLYPARFVASSRYPDLAVGLLAAVCALSGVAALLFACKRFFEGEPANDSR